MASADARRAGAEGVVRRARAWDHVATVVLWAIVIAIIALLVATIGYVVVSGIGKALDPHFLTAKPEQFKEGGGIGPELFNSFYLLVLTLLI